VSFDFELGYYGMFYLLEISRAEYTEAFSQNNIAVAHVDFLCDSHGIHDLRVMYQKVGESSTIQWANGWRINNYGYTDSHGEFCTWAVDIEPVITLSPVMDSNARRWVSFDMIDATYPEDHYMYGRYVRYWKLNGIDMYSMWADTNVVRYDREDGDTVSGNVEVTLTVEVSRNKDYTPITKTFTKLIPISPEPAPTRLVRNIELLPYFVSPASRRSSYRNFIPNGKGAFIHYLNSYTYADLGRKLVSGGSVSEIVGFYPTLFGNVLGNTLAILRYEQFACKIGVAPLNSDMDNSVLLTDINDGNLSCLTVYNDSFIAMKTKANGLCSILNISSLGNITSEVDIDFIPENGGVGMTGLVVIGNTVYFGMLSYTGTQYAYHVKTSLETLVSTRRSGLGLRFVRELEQGKETMRLDKVNQALAMFGMETVPGEKEKTS